MIRKLAFALVLSSALGLSAGEAGSLPWIEVPFLWGSAGGVFTCITRPVPGQIAAITCDPMMFNSFPPPVQRFLLAHEHGHVYQIVYNPQMLYGPYAEYDADCYASIVLAESEPATLAQAVSYFESVLRFAGGGDGRHGNGFQMAQRARECASSVGVPIAAIRYRESRDSGREVIPASFAATEMEGLDPVSAARSDSGSPNPPGPRGEWLENFVSHGPDDVADRGTPSFCTGIEMLLDSAHASFWESSTHTGGVREDVSRSLGGTCRIEGPRSSVVCGIPPGAAAAGQDPAGQLRRCLESGEWRRKCEGEGCATEIYRHPKDPSDHDEVRLTSSASGWVLRIARPGDISHGHDYPGIKPTLATPSVSPPAR